jgi:hypothetical protein
MIEGPDRIAIEIVEVNNLDRITAQLAIAPSPAAH